MMGPVLLIAAVAGLGIAAVFHGSDPDRGRSADAVADQTAAQMDQDASELRRRLDRVLQDTFDKRHLSVEQHAAWQILHGALAYQRDFLVEFQGRRVSAVDHLLAGGPMKGWTTQPGIVLDERTGRRGLRAVLEEGTKSGQGHPDQWLAVLAQCELQPQQKIRIGGDLFTMQDFVEQVQHDVPHNPRQEYSWTLIGLTSYLPTSARWQAADDQTWSIEKLVEIELEHDLNSSACGGSHRLIGITMALNQHLAQGGALEGVWKQADERIQEAIRIARQYQNEDGSFSTNYFARPGRSPDLAHNLGTTGHTLEFLALAMTDQQLDQPWVRRAVVHMCGLFEKTMHLPLECGALYHAAHGLSLYRQRTCGPKRYGFESADDGAPAQAPAPQPAGGANEQETGADGSAESSPSRPV